MYLIIYPICCSKTSYLSNTMRRPRCLDLSNNYLAFSKFYKENIIESRTFPLSAKYDRYSKCYYEKLRLYLATKKSNCVMKSSINSSTFIINII